MHDNGSQQLATPFASSSLFFRNHPQMYSKPTPLGMTLQHDLYMPQPFYRLCHIASQVRHSERYGL